MYSLSVCILILNFYNHVYLFPNHQNCLQTDLIIDIWFVLESHAPPIPPPRLSSKTGATSPHNFYPTNNYAYVHRQELDDTLPLITLNGNVWSLVTVESR